MKYPLKMLIIIRNYSGPDGTTWIEMVIDLDEVQLVALEVNSILKTERIHLMISLKNKETIEKFELACEPSNDPQIKESHQSVRDLLRRFQSMTK